MLRHSMPSERFARAYIECALWSSVDANGEPLDSGDYRLDDATLEALQSEAVAFYFAHDDDLSADPSQGGHDLWLTRNGHGAGFWDGGWPKCVGERLTAAAAAVGEINLYIGDDGAIHASGAVNA